jgi:hypothetical protein
MYDKNTCLFAALASWSIVQVGLHVANPAAKSKSAREAAVHKWSSSGGLRVFPNGIDRTDDATSQATMQ